MSDNLPENVADEESLINGGFQKDRGLINVLFAFLLFKTVPWVIYALTSLETVLSVAMLLISVFADLWMCRRSFSYELVGLSWSIDSPTNLFQGIVTYHCEPDPYVPSALNSNVFWITLVSNAGLFLLTTIANLMRVRLNQFFLLVVIDIFECLNVALFFKSLGVSNRQSEQSFKNMMTGGGQSYQPQTFPNAADIPLDQITLNETQETAEEDDEEEVA